MSKQTAPMGRTDGAARAPATTDARFARFQSDPRFRLPSTKNNKVKLDKRFANILKTDDFSRKASVDRYGRKVGKDQGRKELERLYRLGSDEEDEEETDEGEDDDVVRRELLKAENYDPARDGGFSESSSSEEDSSDDEEDVDEEVEEAELYGDEGAEVPMGEVSRRLAVVNLDWDNIGAADLMAVATSFAPNEKTIRRVTIYPSEFGKERMEREDMEGPAPELFTKKSKKIESDEESDVDSNEDELSSDEEDERIKKSILKEDKGEDFDPSALRKYQLDRLRYYYAVIECTTEDVAHALYESMDGREYLTSSNFFDLRFVPDETTFDEDKPYDLCEEVPEGYAPSDFVTDALTHSKVKLTWDADDAKRKEIQKRAFSRQEIDENDLQAYIGSGSSSEDEDEEEEDDEEIINPMTGEVMETGSVTSRATTRADRRDMLRAALGLPPEPEKARKKDSKKGGKDSGAVLGDMQISFTPGLSASAPKKGAVFENTPEDETTIEKYVRKEKAKKQQKREAMLARREGRDPEEAISALNNKTKAATAAATNGKAAKVSEAATAEEEDSTADPFADPFFADPIATEKEAKATRQKQRKRERLEKEASEKAAKARERAQLELLMDDDKNVRHFDMKAIQKAEKLAARGGKKKGIFGKRSKISLEEKGEGGGDGFEMDVRDPRFKGLYESHEFAIDPSNPRYKGTEGMKKILEEGRRQRDGKSSSSQINGSAAVIKSSQAGKRGRDDAQGDNDVITTKGVDVMDLVNRVKKKART